MRSVLIFFASAAFTSSQAAAFFNSLSIVNSNLAAEITTKTSIPAPSVCLKAWCYWGKLFIKLTVYTTCQKGENYKTFSSG